MTIQYYHCIHTAIYKNWNDSYTFALNYPPVSFLNGLQVNDSANLLFGKAVCSKEDNYVKSVGREFALARLKPVTFLVKEILFNREGMQVKLDAVEGTITLLVKNNHTKAFFINHSNRN